MNTTEMISIDEMLPEEKGTYKTNIGELYYCGNRAWSGKNNMSRFPTHWMPKGIKKDRSPYKPFRLGRKQQKVILNDQGLEVCTFHEKNKHLAPMVVDFLNEFVTGRKQGDFKWKDDKKDEIEFVEDPKGFATMFYPANSMNKDSEPSFLKKVYVGGVDPANELRYASNIAIRYSDGKIERFLPEDEQKAHDDIEAGASLAHIYATHKRREEIFFERFKERMKSAVNKSIWEGQLSTIRIKSKLNIIKYRRK